MDVIKKTKLGRLTGAEGESLRAYYDNRGEPYRSGLTVEFEDSETSISIFLEKYQVEMFKEMLDDGLVRR